MSDSLTPKSKFEMSNLVAPWPMRAPPRPSYKSCVHVLLTSPCNWVHHCFSNVHTIKSPSVYKIMVIVIRCVRDVYGKLQPHSGQQLSLVVAVAVEVPCRTTRPNTPSSLSRSFSLFNISTNELLSLPHHGHLTYQLVSPLHIPLNWFNAIN